MFKFDKKNGGLCPISHEDFFFQLTEQNQVIKRSQNCIELGGESTSYMKENGNWRSEIISLRTVEVYQVIVPQKVQLEKSCNTPFPMANKTPF